MVFNLYSKYKSRYFYLKQQKTFNLDEGKLKAITDLCQNKSIIVCKLDKGNGVVLLNKSDYDKKMEDILLHKSKFKPASNNILKQLKKFQSFLFVLSLDQSTKKFITEFDQHLLHFLLFMGFLNSQRKHPTMTHNIFYWQL